MPLKAMTAGRLDYTDRVVTFDPATIQVSGPRTIAKVEAAVNAYLAANCEPGEVWRIHIYTLNPLNYAMTRNLNGMVPEEPWWPDA